MKKNKAGIFTRDPDKMSVEAMSQYVEVVQKCCDVLGMPLIRGERSLSLLSGGGSVIPFATGWILGGYMRQLHRGPKSFCLGVGYIKKKVCGS